MNSKNTWLWLLLAATLFATICYLDRHFRPSVATATEGWPDFQSGPATSVQVIPAGALEIRADRTNNAWFLTKPYVYPAQTAAIQALLDALAKLTPAMRITAGELRQQPGAEGDYGFDTPRYSLVLQTRQQEWQLKIGRLTTPGNQVYLRVVGVDGAFVTDAGWLKYLPASANVWRDTELVQAGGQVDELVLTNGAKVVELRQDPTNHLWRMTRPLSARADSDRINRALQELRSARVAEFVTDDTNADLTAYELQPANLDLWLGHGGSLTDGLHLGKALTNNPALVYARREGWNGVVTTLKDPLALWRGAVADFRNPHLLDSTAPINQIDMWVADNTNRFSLQRSGSNVWQMAGETFPVDAGTVQNFLTVLGNLSATEYVDAVSATDLQTYGLTKPGLQITLRPVAGDTNQVLTQLSFSAPQTNGVFVRRSDEDCLYRLNPEDLTRIPQFAWQFRDRQIWNFKEQDIKEINVRQNGQTRRLLHLGREKWMLSGGAPGQVFGPSIEETAHQLGVMAAYVWVDRKVTNPAPYGVDTNSLQIEVDLNNGRKYSLDYGKSVNNYQTALVTLEDERWAFVVPEILNQLVLSYLTIPANAP